jgi:hypothetical protein
MKIVCLHCLALSSACPMSSKCPANVAVAVFQCACQCVPLFTSASQLQAGNSTCVHREAHYEPDVGADSSCVTDIYNVAVLGHGIYKAAMSHLLLPRIIVVSLPDYSLILSRLSTISLSLSESVKKDSSVPRPGGSAFIVFSKALVGEHRASTFLYGMAMMLTPHCSPDTRTFFIIQILSNMHSYMVLTVLALAAFTGFSVLSAPIR